MEKILIVDDNPDNLDLIAHMLETGGIASETASSGMEALAKMDMEPFPIILSDLMMPQMDGIQLLEKIKKSWPETEVLIVTAHGSIKSAVEAIKKGAYSYILKPFESEDLLNEVVKISEYVKMKRENTALKMELANVKRMNPMIGATPQMKAIYELIDTVSATNATVLILGESGTGKELVANAIHNQSKRKNAPFVKLACSALAETLLESELFGHEKGAFTGAVVQRKGRFEYASGGTLFLDEIGDISAAVQVKLLRVLQEKEFERVGGVKTIKTDVRIITATNRDLEKEVMEGRFREDLYYRLNVITIKMPPLRERKEDIHMLVKYFLEKYRIEVNRNVERITDRALKVLQEYSWPGNIRELQNVLERSVVLARGKEIDVEDLPDNLTQKNVRTFHFEGDALPPLKEAKHAFEKQYLEEALALNSGNISRTAEMIHLARKNLQDKIKTYGIDVSSLVKRR